MRFVKRFLALALAAWLCCAAAGLAALLGALFCMKEQKGKK